MKPSRRLVAAFLFTSTVSCPTNSAWATPDKRDTLDDPPAERPGSGNAALHTWWPLTPPEADALEGVAAARRGDAHALLALGLVASGDHRDAASHADFTARVDRFVAEVRPKILAAADDWHRGYELNRAMHQQLFKGEGTELGGYELEQARLTDVFTTGHYNCLSSAVLYVVLARGFGLPVRAAFVPSHVFVEMGLPGGKVIEIETTSATGFDWIHDARFYEKESASWSGSRGRRPRTRGGYHPRHIIAPDQLMALAMRDARSGEDKDRPRLAEVAALVDPEDVEGERERLRVTVNEAIELDKANAWRTMARFFDVVSPAIDEVGARTHDAKTAERASWASWYHANALLIVGRADEAMTRMKNGYAHVDPTWPDAETLRQNYVAVLDTRLGALVSAKDYGKAIALYAENREACRADQTCTSNMGVAYLNQAGDAQNAGDWPAARSALQACRAELPDDGRCKDGLADLESRHQF